MNHDHDHHEHHHHHDIASGLTFEGKIDKLLEHWIKHNIDHADTYRDWARQSKEHHLENISEILEEAARLNETINAVLKTAVQHLSKQKT